MVINGKFKYHVFYNEDANEMTKKLLHPYRSPQAIIFTNGSLDKEKEIFTFCKSSDKSRSLNYLVLDIDIYTNSF